MQPDAGWQESSTQPCDTGRDVATMRARWPALDWSGVDPVFPRKEGAYAGDAAALQARAGRVLDALRGCPEPVVAVVSHASFLSRVSRRHFFNADYRVFDVGPDGLVEWGETEEKGGGRGLSWKGEALPVEGGRESAGSRPKANPATCHADVD